MRILTTSDLDYITGGLAPLLPITWAVVADTGFAGAIGGAWAAGWGIGTFVGDNISTYSTNAEGENPSGGGSTGSCRRPEPEPEPSNCDGSGSCW